MASTAVTASIPVGLVFVAGVLRVNFIADGGTVSSHELHRVKRGTTAAVTAAVIMTKRQKYSCTIDRVRAMHGQRPGCNG